MPLKALVIGLAAVVILIVGAAVGLTRGKTPPPPATRFSSQDSERPRVEVSEKFFDLGTMKVSDVGTKDFELKNAGTRPLQLLNINSSCGCTVSQIIYQGKTTEEFGMHAQSGYVSDILPGETAIVRLTYRPAVMPVYGPVDREVYVTTNDPDNAKLIFRIKATVK